MYFLHVLYTYEHTYHASFFRVPYPAKMDRVLTASHLMQVFRGRLEQQETPGEGLTPPVRLLPGRQGGHDPVREGEKPGGPPAEGHGPPLNLNPGSGGGMDQLIRSRYVAS